jgi:UDP-3-O-[3-hydroxymyristoyl] glucosamine N-acyltransferase
MRFYDFGDGRGRVPARQHENGKGWVELTADVSPEVFVGAQVRVYGRPKMSGAVRIHGMVVISGEPRLEGKVILQDFVHVLDQAQLTGGIFQGNAVIRGGARITDKVLVTDDALLEDYCDLRDHVYVGGHARIGGFTLLKGFTVVEGTRRLYAEVPPRERRKKPSEDPNVRRIVGELPANLNLAPRFGSYPGL